MTVSLLYLQGVPISELALPNEDHAHHWPYAFPEAIPLAHYFAAQNAKPQERWALICDEAYHAALAIQAALQLGLHLHLCDPTQPAAERKKDLNAQKIQKIIHASELARDAEHWVNAGGIPEHLDVAAMNKATKQSALIISSSGSSGARKWVHLGIEALVSSAKQSSEHLELERTYQYGLTLPLHHVGGLGIILRALYCGCSVAFPVHTERFPTALFNQEINSGNIEVLSLVPTMLKRLLDDRSDEPWPATLRCILIGGAACPPSLYHRSRAAGLRPLLSYGLSETCGLIATNKENDDHKHPAILRCFGDQNIHIENNEHICIHSPQLFTGYQIDAKLQQRQSDHFLSQDLGEWWDKKNGQFKILGRNDRIIISGGKNISAEHIEERLDNCPGVDLCFVAGKNDEEWGQAVSLLYVGSATPKSISEFLKKHLRPYAIPKYYFRRDELPLLSNGKIDHGACRELIQIA